jgi:glutaredoxin 3
MESIYIRVVGRTTPVCAYCELAKKLLERKGLAYEFVELATSPEYQNLFAELGIRTVPAIFLDSEYLGGYTELLAYV